MHSARLTSQRALWTASSCGKRAVRHAAGRLPVRRLAAAALHTPALTHVRECPAARPLAACPAGCALPLAVLKYQLSRARHLPWRCAWLLLLLLPCLRAWWRVVGSTHLVSASGFTWDGGPGLGPSPAWKLAGQGLAAAARSEKTPALQARVPCRPAFRAVRHAFSRQWVVALSLYALCLLRHQQGLSRSNRCLCSSSHAGATI